MTKHLFHYLLVGFMALIFQVGAPIASAQEEEGDSGISINIEVTATDEDSGQAPEDENEDTIVIVAGEDFFDDFDSSADKDHKGIRLSFSDEHKSKLLLAIVICAIIFLSPAFFVGVVLYYLYRRRRLAHDTAYKLAEKGLEIPPALLRPEKRDLRNGILLITGGIGISALCQVVIDGLWGLGLLPLFLGLGYLIVWKLGENNKKKRIAPKIGDFDIDN